MIHKPKLAYKIPDSGMQHGKGSFIIQACVQVMIHNNKLTPELCIQYQTVSGSTISVFLASSLVY